MKHHYGDNVHFFDHPHLLGLLARLCQPTTFQPEINHLINYLYSQLLDETVKTFFPYETMSIPTRMHQDHPEVLLQTQQIQYGTRAVCVNLARAGTFPSRSVYRNAFNRNTRIFKNGHAYPP